MYKLRRLILLAILVTLIGGCAGTGGGLGSISKTNQLMPGMSPEQVKEILGDQAIAGSGLAFCLSKRGGSADVGSPTCLAWRTSGVRVI